MYGVVCGVHQKERERKRESERRLGVTRRFIFFFFASIYSFPPEMQECKRLLFPTSGTNIGSK